MDFAAARRRKAGWRPAVARRTAVLALIAVLQVTAAAIGAANEVNAPTDRERPVETRKANPPLAAPPAGIVRQKRPGAPGAVLSNGDDGLDRRDGRPIAGLADLARSRFTIGAAIFAADWVPAPDVSDGADGLGPLYNATSCAACHGNAAPRQSDTLSQTSGVQADGDSTADAAADAVGVLRRRVVRFIRGDPVYGTQLQDRAIPGHAAEGKAVVTWQDVQQVPFADGGEPAVLRRPRISIAAPGYDAPEPDHALVLRRSPPLAGLGLVAAIAESDIAAGADPDDRDRDGISGREAKAVDPATEEQRLARFGWKASAVSLAAQTADAFRLDMGLSSPLANEAYGDCTSRQTACRNAADGASPAKGGYEVSAEEVALVVAYIEGLAPPSTRSGAPTTAPGSREAAGPQSGADVLQGAAQFNALGCPACHRPSFTTARRTDAPHLAGKRVPLFSDLLLHDMGEGLTDAPANEGTAPGDRDQNEARHREWRTAPLWGLAQRLEEIANGEIDGLLHDGRARTIAEAILWHGGEAAAARERYRRLPANDRAALAAYLARL